MTWRERRRFVFVGRFGKWELWGQTEGSEFSLNKLPGWDMAKATGKHNGKAF